MTLIVCDDRSVDDTSGIVGSAGAIVDRHKSNKGYGASLRTLFNLDEEKYADMMVTVGSDGQHNVHQMSNLLQPILDQKADLVISSRFLDKKDSNRFRFTELWVLSC